MPRNSSVTDTRLIRRSQQGDRRAFRALLTRYDWRLRGLAHALLLDSDHVDAVLRVAYVKAWREVVRIDGRDDASGWLYRVVYNACIDGLRREGTRVGPAPPAAADVPLADDVAGEATQPPVQAAPAGGNGSTPAGMAQDRQARVAEALASLAPTDRVAVVLVDREGFSPGAAARILGLAPEILGARLATARARLKEQLARVLVAAPAPAAEAGAQADGAEEKTDKPQTKPKEPQAEEPQPAQAQPEEAQAEEAQAAHAEPEEPQAEEPQPAQAEPVEPKAEEAQAAQAEPEEPQADEVKSGRPRAEAPPPERAEPEDAQAEDAGPEQPPPEEHGPADEPPPVDAPPPVTAAEPEAEAAAEPKADAAAEAEDTTPAEPEDTKVASRSAAGASPNGANGPARSNGSDDGGGGGS